MHLTILFYTFRVVQHSHWHFSNFECWWDYQHGISSFALTRLQSGSYDAMELFSGVATLSRCWREAGYPTCNLDIRDWNPWAEARAAAGLPISNGNPLDLTTPSGFGFLSFRLCNFMSERLLVSKGVVWYFIEGRFHVCSHFPEATFDEHHESQRQCRGFHRITLLYFCGNFSWFDIPELFSTSRWPKLSLMPNLQFAGIKECWFFCWSSVRHTVHPVIWNPHSSDQYICMYIYI